MTPTTASPLPTQAPAPDPPRVMPPATSSNGTKEKKKTKLGSKRGIETMFRTQYPMHVDLSALADAKANIMISINGIMVSILLASISPKIDSNPWLIFPTSTLLVGCLISLVFAILAALPRVNRNEISLADVREERANILFFGNFTRLSKRDYLIGMTEMLNDKTRLYTSMMSDIYALGGVLDRKFRLLRISYLAFTVALIVGVTLFIGVYTFLSPMGVSPRVLE
jgi:hypothetical protein